LFSCVDFVLGAGMYVKGTMYRGDRDSPRRQVRGQG
jgi:hypothetical protein